MKLLVSDIGVIVWGISAAASRAPLKIVFFLFGVCYGANTFYTGKRRRGGREGRGEVGQPSIGREVVLERGRQAAGQGGPLAVDWLQP